MKGCVSPPDGRMRHAKICMTKWNERAYRGRWAVAWGLQIAAMFAAGLLTAASHGVHPVLHGALTWVLMPLAGAVTAYRAVRRGLLNYAAWIAPPACLYLANRLVWGYAPSAGAALLCAFVSLVGAAAGEVAKRQRH